MGSFSECRSCYNHIGGKLAVSYFSYLMNNHYISYVSHTESLYLQHRIPLIINSAGINYFKFLMTPLKSYNFAFACLDGTEKRHHLAGKIGSILYQYFINTEFIYRNDRDRILVCTMHAKNILSGKPDQKILI